jgi:hypothetical protein
MKEAKPMRENPLHYNDEQEGEGGYCGDAKPADCCGGH